MLKASDVMSPGAIFATEDMPVRAVVQLMLKNHISGLPVVDSKRNLTGIVTEGDLLRRVELGTGRRRSWWMSLFNPAQTAKDYIVSHGRRAAEVMTRKVYTVESNTPLNEIVALMEQHKIKRVPVMEHGRVVAVVSRADLLKIMARLPAGDVAQSVPDGVIESDILEELRKQPWWTSHSRVVVANGIATLQGVVFDNDERQAMRVAAANTAGVKEVRDETIIADSGH